MSKTRLATPHMALDERDYMRERAAAQHSEWLGERSPIRGHREDLELLSEGQRADFEEDPRSAPRPGKNSRTAAAAVVVAVGVMLYAGTYLLATAARNGKQGPPPQSVSEARVPPTRAPNPITQPVVVEPPTSVAPVWTPSSEAGRLVVSSAAGAGSATIRVSRDDVVWDGYVRTGETATIELVPGVYWVTIIPRVGLTAAPVQVAVESPSSTVGLELKVGPPSPTQ